MYERVLSEVERFAGAYPAAFALLVTMIVVPLIGSALSFADGWAAKRWPVAVALLRALLPDPKRAAAILTARVLDSQKLPVPPEVRELAIRRFERADDDPQKTPVGPRKPPPLPLLCLLLTGCADLTYARTVRDAAHDAAETAAPIVDLLCVSQQARDLAEVRALPEHSIERERRAEQAQALQRDRRCPEVVAAYSTLRVASITLDATVAAAETGQCMAARSQSCDVGGAAVKAAQATAEIAGLVKQLESSK